jgi:hypothetical protein
MQRWPQIAAGFFVGVLIGAALVLLIQSGSSLEPTGVALGFLIGLITGIALMLLISTAVSSHAGSHARTAAMITELLAIPTFWFGGPWLSGTLLKVVDLQSVLQSYMVVLAVTFGILPMYPLVIVVVYLGRQMGDS